MGKRSRVVGVAAAGVVAALTAGAAVAVTNNSDGAAGASQPASTQQPEPFGESDLPNADATKDAQAPASANLDSRVLAAGANGKLPRNFQVKTKDPVFFITVDDGNTKNAAALEFVTQRRIPATVFLTNSSVAGQWDYFRKFTSFGGSVENHTMTHRSLTTGSTPLAYEICRTQQIYANKFGHAPSLLRPPYGNGGYANTSKAKRKAIDTTASKCGIRHVVMWNAVAENGRFQFIRGSLKRGDIVLFHFTPSLAGELKKVMKMAKKKGLHPAPLTNYLK